MNILIISLTFLAMEVVAWLTHKFVMHGFLWYLHKDHHQGSKGFFEKNDAFFLIFAIPSAYFIANGLIHTNSQLFIGIGIAIYGAAYFFIHDIIIHQRFKLFRNWDNAYVKGIRRGHKMHHKHLEKHDGESFGMLLVPFKYFKQK